MRERKHWRLDDVPRFTHVHSFLRHGDCAVRNSVEDVVELCVRSKRLTNQLTSADVERCGVTEKKNVSSCKKAT